MYPVTSHTAFAVALAIVLGQSNRLAESEFVAIAFAAASFEFVDSVAIDRL